MKYSYFSIFHNLRSGGGIGSGDIRKMAYFESSIDPAVTRDEVCGVVTKCFLSVVIIGLGKSFLWSFIVSPNPRGLQEFQKPL